MPLHEAEKRIIGTSHAEIGAYVLGLWNLPPVIIEAVAGDAEQAAAHLAESLELGKPPPSSALENHGFYDLVRDDPAFQAQVERVREYEAGVRAELRAAGL